MTVKKTSARPRLSWTRWIQAQWPQVRIDDIDTLPARAGTPDDARTLLVHVRLGSLTPADVRVEMTMGNATVARDPSSAAIRLGSTRSYGGGNFAFDAELPRAALAAPTGFSIRVVPDLWRRMVSLPPVVKSARACAVASSVDQPIEHPVPVCLAAPPQQVAATQSSPIHSHRSIV
jgi:hypothetical protein